MNNDIGPRYFMACPHCQGRGSLPIEIVSETSQLSTEHGPMHPDDAAAARAYAAHQKTTGEQLYWRVVDRREPSSVLIAAIDQAIKDDKQRAYRRVRAMLEPLREELYTATGKGAFICIAGMIECLIDEEESR